MVETFWGDNEMNMEDEEQNFLPEPPKFTEQQIKYCKESGDYKPILFEWYKFVGSLCFTIAFIQPNSPAYRIITPQHYYILSGLLNRCAKLMLSNIALSHEGKYGETTVIIDRCIFESAIKVIWYCENPSNEEFTRYLADGLKTELEFKERIEADIVNNGGQTLPIQTRMLSSIDRHITASGLSQEEIRSAKKQRDIASILDSLGYDRILYIVAHKIGSHHIHGTWTSLLYHYLEKSENTENFIFAPSGDFHDTSINQFMFIPIIVLNALQTFVRYVLDPNEAEALCRLLESTKEEIRLVYDEVPEDAQ
jgi:hypothetical protein